MALCSTVSLPDLQWYVFHILVPLTPQLQTFCVHDAHRCAVRTVLTVASHLLPPWTTVERCNFYEIGYVTFRGLSHGVHLFNNRFTEKIGPRHGSKPVQPTRNNKDTAARQIGQMGDSSEDRILEALSFVSDKVGRCAHSSAVRPIGMSHTACTLRPGVARCSWDRALQTL